MEPALLTACMPAQLSSRATSARPVESPGENVPLACAPRACSNSGCRVRCWPSRLVRLGRWLTQTNPPRAIARTQGRNHKIAALDQQPSHPRSRIHETPAHSSLTDGRIGDGRHSRDPTCRCRFGASSHSLRHRTDGATWSQPVCASPRFPDTTSLRTCSGTRSASCRWRSASATTDARSADSVSARAQRSVSTGIEWRCNVSRSVGSRIPA